LTKASQYVNLLTMAGKTKLVGFRIEPAAWDAFCQAAKYYDMQPQDCLRDLIYHAKRAIEAVETGKVKSINGDMAEFLVKEFPNLSPGQLKNMARLLEAAALKIEEGH